MLRIHSAPHIRLTTDNIRYLQVSDQHKLAVDTFRRIPGQPYKLDHEGIPRLDRVRIDKKEERQVDVRRFARAIYGLNELWERLITDRNAFNHEIMQFPHANYRRPSILDAHGKETIKLKTPQSTNKSKEEEKKVDLSTLGTQMDKSPQALARRAEHMKESREWHSYLRMEPFLNVFGTFGLFMPDIGYALSILGSFGNGIKHPDRDVRESSIIILTAITHGTALILKTDLNEITEYNSPALQSFYATEALSVMNAILRLLYSEYYGVNDSDQEVKEKAGELEEDIIDLSIEIKRLITVPDSELSQSIL